MTFWHKCQMTPLGQHTAFMYNTVFLTNCLLSTGRAWRGWTCWICRIRWTPCKPAANHLAIQYEQILFKQQDISLTQIHLHTHNFPDIDPTPLLSFPTGCWRSAWSKRRAWTFWSKGRSWPLRPLWTRWTVWTCCQYHLHQTHTCMATWQI